MFPITFVAIGGAFGAMLRFFIARKTEKSLFGTWLVNIVGSLLLAIIFRFYLLGAITEVIWLGLGIGFCGAFTTFSTFGSEMVQLLLAQKYRKAVIYGVSSFSISILLVFIILLI